MSRSKDDPEEIRCRIGCGILALEMTFEERLDRIAERHQALAESVELLTTDIRQMAEENKERDRRWDNRWGEVVEAITRLVHVAEIH